MMATLLNMDGWLRPQLRLGNGHLYATSAGGGIKTRRKPQGKAVGGGQIAPADTSAYADPRGQAYAFRFANLNA
jgi:hypothetical protein